jgi:hypothetical protein
MALTREPTTATLIITLHSGHQEHLFGVDLADARRARSRFSDWAALGGKKVTRDEWPDGVALDELSETTGESLSVPYAAIAAVRVIPEVNW